MLIFIYNKNRFIFRKLIRPPLLLIGSGKVEIKADVKYV